MNSQRRWIFLFALMLLFIVGITISADLRLLPLSRIRIPYYDKFCHFLLYGILAFFLQFALKFRAWQFGRVRVPVAFVVVTVLCVLDETQQMFMDNRAADVSDFLADVLGITTFLGFTKIKRQRSLDANLKRV